MVRSAFTPLLAFATFVLAGPAPAQAPAAARAPATAAAEAPAPSEDRVFALVQAGKCAQAKLAAEQAGDTNLAGQIELMCGHAASGPSASKGGGGGRRGAGGQGAAAGSGRRGGG